MSKQYTECPLYNHATCKELHNPNLCAIVRDDKSCFKKRQKSKDAEDCPGNCPGTDDIADSLNPLLNI